jgi:hypothetical protein
MQIHILERFPVIHIARSKDKVRDFPLSLIIRCSLKP